MRRRRSSPLRIAQQHACLDGEARGVEQEAIGGVDVAQGVFREIDRLRAWWALSGLSSLHMRVPCEAKRRRGQQRESGCPAKKQTSVPPPLRRRELALLVTCTRLLNSISKPPAATTSGG